jgi:hypothetical protein
MKTKLKLFIVSTALCTLPLLAGLAAAQTVTTKSVTQESATPPGSTPINLGNFDINKDGILSSNEVGEMLFKLFDTDRNNVIDSKEFADRTILTVVPMEKQTTITYDFDNDGSADKTQTTYETFTQETQLARFGTNPSGLSPREFLDKPYAVVDTDGSGGVDLPEWKNAYIFRIAPVPVH